MTYIRDCDKVSGILDERDHERVFEDRVWASPKNENVGFAPQVSRLRTI